MKYLAVIVLLVLGSCARNSSPPTNQHDACAILDQRSGWLRSLQLTELNWGVPVHVQMAIIWKESSYRARAKTRKVYILGSIPNGHISTAYGFPQALNGTWEEYQTETRSRGAQRHNFGDATDFIGWYSQKSKQRNGIELDDAYNLYLAYHEGHTGFARGSYREKDWLLNVARQVRNRAAQYETQLETCS